MVKVKEVMKKHIVTVEPSVTMSTVAKILTNNRVGCVIVMENEKPVGMISDTDIVTVIAKNKNPEKIKFRDVRSIRNKEFVSVTPDENIMRVAKKFVKTGRKRFPVIEDGVLKGIISTKEIILIAPELLEILSEKLKAQVDSVARPEQVISGICERCGDYSEELKSTNGRWICQGCRD